MAPGWFRQLRAPYKAFGFSLVSTLWACTPDGGHIAPPVSASGAAGSSSATGNAGTGGAAGAAGAPGEGAAGASGSSELTWPPTLRHRLSVGLQQGCVLTADASVVCWGDPIDRVPPMLAPEGRFSDLSSDGATACGVREDGSISCWGDDDGGFQIPPSGTFSNMDVGVSRSCAIGLDDAVSCWGVDSAAVQPPADSYRSVQVGHQYACGLSTAGTLRCNGTARAATSAPADGPYVMLAGGKTHACALKSDHTVACWGVGGPQEPVDGSDPDQISYGQATPPEGEFVYIAAGTFHSCALRSDGEAVCWGAGRTEGDCVGDLNACGMALPPPGPFVELALGYSHSCGLRPDHSIACWGSNTGNRATPPSGPL